MPFRDHWGVVWALRVRERFNRSAEAAGWPIRLTWHGVVPAPDGGGDRGGAPPEVAEATLIGLLRRFATEDRLASWAEGRGGTREPARRAEGGPRYPCQSAVDA
jgi:hypothetical protein